MHKILSTVMIHTCPLSSPHFQVSFRFPRTTNILDSLHPTIQRIPLIDKARLNAGLKASIIHQNVLAS